MTDNIDPNIYIATAKIIEIENRGIKYLNKEQIIIWLYKTSTLNSTRSDAKQICQMLAEQLENLQI
jgi:hypothetical protein